MASMIVTIAAHVPEGTVVAANPRSRMGEPLNLEVVRLGEPGHDNANRAVRWCTDLAKPDLIVGFVLEGEQVVVLAD